MPGAAPNRLLARPSRSHVCRSDRHAWPVAPQALGAAAATTALLWSLRRDVPESLATGPVGSQESVLGGPVQPTAVGFAVRARLEVGHPRLDVRRLHETSGGGRGRAASPMRVRPDRPIPSIQIDRSEAPERVPRDRYPLRRVQ